jgi:hypothetical protein
MQKKFACLSQTNHPFLGRAFSRVGSLLQLLISPATQQCISFVLLHDVFISSYFSMQMSEPIRNPPHPIHVFFSTSSVQGFSFPLLIRSNGEFEELNNMDEVMLGV